MRLPIIFVVVAFSFAGCFNDSKFPLLAPDARPGEFRIEQRTLDIESDNYVADYGTITVPENRSNATSRTIQIPFLRIRSLSKTPAEPVFAMTGGPGNSNITWDLRQMLPVLANHDFVMVGYRGVDGSSVLQCPEVIKALKQGDPLSDESMKRIGEAWATAAARFSDEGVDLGGYNMLECIEDFEEVRTALGFERIDLISKSYGTRLAYLYGVKYPTRIFRSAMVSVNPPGRFVWDAHMIDAQLKYYSSLWSKDPDASKRLADPYQTMKRVLNNMPEQWMGIRIVPGKVKVATFALLYHRNTAAQVFDAFAAADQGDASGLALMCILHDFVVPSLMVWGDALKAVSADYDSTRNYIGESDPSGFAPFGSPLNKLLWGPMKYGHLPIHMLPEEFRKCQPSAVETLLVSGSIDFSTPAEYATSELLPNLVNGRQIILSECGHTNDILNPSIGNAAPLIKEFYDVGIAGNFANEYLPMNFSVGFGFPAIAKTAVTVGLLLVVGVILLCYYFIRRLRLKKVSQP